MNSKAILTCQHLAKTYHDGQLNVNVLKNVNLEVAPGEQVAIVGRSGAGKSTLLHLLGGLDKPSEGEVWVAGKCMSRLSEAKRGFLRNQKLGFVYQFHHLLPEFTLLENVCIPLLIRGVPPKEAIHKAMPLLEKLSIDKRKQHKPGELSGGERQRTAMARALITDPVCILADEPTGNLDQATAEQVMSAILELNQVLNTSLIIVTHDLQLAKKMQRTLTIEEGELH